MHRKQGEQRGSQVRLWTPKPSLSDILPPALPLKRFYNLLTQHHQLGPVVQWTNPWGTFLIQTTTLLKLVPVSSLLLQKNSPVNKQYHCEHTLEISSFLHREADFIFFLFSHHWLFVKNLTLVFLILLERLDCINVLPLLFILQLLINNRIKALHIAPSWDSHQSYLTGSA